MTLAKFLNKKPRGFKTEFARKIGTSPSFLRQVETGYSKCPLELAKKIEKEAGGKVKKHDLRPDVWEK